MDDLEEVPSVVWLRDGVDRLFHAVSVWELPAEQDGPMALCGLRVQVVALLDEPGAGWCTTCKDRAVVTVVRRGGEHGRRCCRRG